MANREQALEYLVKVYVYSTDPGDPKLEAKSALVESLRMYEHLVDPRGCFPNLGTMRKFARRNYIMTLLNAGADPDDVITKLALLLG